MENEVINSVVETVAGQDVLPLVEVLKGKKDVSEFTIAEELKEEINTIRNKLYRLYESNLVEFTRKKDKKKGWYIYYWTFIPSRIAFLMKEMKKKRIGKLKQKLAAEQNSNFFSCENECTRQTFEQAMDHEFKCLECGSMMNQENNEKRIENIKQEIEKLEKEMKEIPEIVVPHHEIELPNEENDEIKVKPVKIKEKHPEIKKIPAKKPETVRVNEKKIVVPKKPFIQKKPVKSAFISKFKSKFVNKSKK